MCLWYKWGESDFSVMPGCLDPASRSTLDLPLKKCTDGCSWRFSSREELRNDFPVCACKSEGNINQRWGIWTSLNSDSDDSRADPSIWACYLYLWWNHRTPRQYRCSFTCWRCHTSQAWVLWRDHTDGFWSPQNMTGCRSQVLQRLNWWLPWSGFELCVVGWGFGHSASAPSHHTEHEGSTTTSGTACWDKINVERSFQQAASIWTLLRIWQLNQSPGKWLISCTCKNWHRGLSFSNDIHFQKSRTKISFLIVLIYWTFKDFHKCLCTTFYLYLETQCERQCIFCIF